MKLNLQQFANKKILIVLDPGHGGIDSGATGNGYKEKDIVLKMALDVKKELIRHNCEVVMTRETDRYISITERYKLANKYDAVIFVSIHLNSFNSVSNGVETLYWHTSQTGKKYATEFQKIFIQATKMTDRGAKARDNLGVLRGSKTTAILLETGFISNKSDIDYVINNFDFVVETIAKGLLYILGYQYVSKDTKPCPPKPTKPFIDTNKINARIISEYVSFDGFKHNNMNFITVNDSHIAVREILEALDLKVGWDDDLKLITADTSYDVKKKKEFVNVILLGSEIQVEATKKDNKYFMKLNSGYFSIRDIFEAMNLKVTWNNKGNKILISK